jgi:hypothetical protein
MPRTTADEVRLINGSTLTDPAINPFISAASCMVEKLVDSGCVDNVTDDCLSSAETFLTCHIMSGTSVGESGGGGIKTDERFENYAVKFQRSMTGQGVLGTSYGITANALLNGCLVELDKRQTNIMFFGGA